MKHLSCTRLEQSVLNTAPVRETVDRLGIRCVIADLSKPNEEISNLLRRIRGSELLPLIAIFPAGSPEKPILIKDFYTPSQLLSALEKAGPSKNVGTGEVATGGEPQDPVVMSKLP